MPVVHFGEYIMELEKNMKLVVLIDADNASADIIEPLLEEIAKYGVASVKRIYGDWSNGNLKKWQEVLLPHAIIPIQQFSYTKGKNATDMAMVIDAMDLLYSRIFDGFCIVSSDSDFTRLASRIRENGLSVYGFGERKTPEAFRKACDKFIYTENLRISLDEMDLTIPSKNEVVGNEAKNNNGKPRRTANELKCDTALMNLIRNAVAEYADSNGWANLGRVGQYILQVNSDFDSRNYGYAKLSSLIKAIDLFETNTRSNKFYIKNKRKTQTK